MDLNETRSEGRARHPWETVRAEFFGRVLGTAIGPGTTRGLDAGSGDAFPARQFVERYRELEITCFDPGYAEAEQPPEPVDRIRFTAELPDGEFDVVTALDVLEHVEDHYGFLATLVGRLRPGGYLVISVPAWPVLFSSHDVALKHFRRYTPRSLRAVLDSTGLQTLESGGLFHSLLPPRLVLVQLEKRRARGGDDGDGAVPQHSLEWRGGELSRRAIEATLMLDIALTRLASSNGIYLPGLSTWALCRKAAS